MKSGDKRENEMNYVQETNIVSVFHLRSLFRFLDSEIIMNKERNNRFACILKKKKFTEFSLLTSWILLVKLHYYVYRFFFNLMYKSLRCLLNTNYFIKKKTDFPECNIVKYR